MFALFRVVTAWCSATLAPIPASTAIPSGLPIPPGGAHSFAIWAPNHARPDRRTLVTLLDAGEYVAALPKKETDLTEWQTAIGGLMVIVEHGGPTMFVRIGVMRALNRGHVREFNASRKNTHWGKGEAEKGSVTNQT